MIGRALELKLTSQRSATTRVAACRRPRQSSRRQTGTRPARAQSNSTGRRKILNTLGVARYRNGNAREVRLDLKRALPLVEDSTTLTCTFWRCVTPG